jgi:hypothetical protein
MNGRIQGPRLGCFREIARVLVRFDHVADVIINTDLSAM